MMRPCFLSVCASATLVLLGGVSVGQTDDAPPLKAVLWVGGFAHDFDAYADVMQRFLTDAMPIEIEVVRDGSFLDSPDVGDLDVIIMNHCFELAEGVVTPEQEEKLFELVRGGMGVVAVHASYYSFTDRPAFRELYGATFTQHGESDIYIDVEATEEQHPITEGLTEPVRLHSELYESTPLADDCLVLAGARESEGETTHPSVWVRPFGEGRVAVLLPAHWPDAYDVQPFRDLISKSTLWACYRLDAPGDAREE